MVKVRKVIEKVYSDRCSIIEKQKVLNTNKTTSFIEKVVHENMPCRLAFKNITSGNKNQVNVELESVIKLFISPDIKILEGSKVVVTRGDNVTTYVHSGIAAVFETHQEVILLNEKGSA